MAIIVCHKSKCAEHLVTFDGRSKDIDGIIVEILSGLPNEYFNALMDSAEVFCSCGSSFRQTNPQAFSEWVRSEHQAFLERKVKDVFDGIPFTVGNIEVYNDRR